MYVAKPSTRIGHIVQVPLCTRTLFSIAISLCCSFLACSSTRYTIYVYNLAEINDIITIICPDFSQLKKQNKPSCMYCNVNMSQCCSHSHIVLTSHLLHIQHNQYSRPSLTYNLHVIICLLLITFKLSYTSGTQRIPGFFPKREKFIHENVMFFVCQSLQISTHTLLNDDKNVITIFS